MTRLDAELVIEIKRRTEMNKSTQMVRNNSLKGALSCIAVVRAMF